MTNEFIKQRRDLLVDPTTGILSPAATNVYKYAPWDHSDYYYANKVGSLAGSKWQKLLNITPVDLIETDPFTTSKYRTGLACWDAAIAIPACSLRSNTTTLLKQIGAVRNTNTYWTTEVATALKLVGPLEPDKLLRPKASFMVDLTQDVQGWDILEAAHILAHVRGDFEKVGPKPRRLTSYYFKQALSEIIVSIIFDLPIGIKEYRNHPIGGPNLPYGIFVNTTDSFATPFVRINCKDKTALEPDNTIAIIQTAIHIEPYPYGFTSGTLGYDLNDRWACAPTIINIVGFEIVDYLLHQNIIVNNKKSEYAMHYLDLLPPNLINDYIELGKQHGEFKPDNVEWFKFGDWLDSQSFKTAKLSTPPLPCLDCLMHNYNSEGKPIKPKGWIKKNKAWDRYTKEIKSIFNLIKNATKMYEAQFLTGGLKSLKLEWQARIRGWKIKLTNLKRTELLFTARSKLKRGLNLSKREETRMDDYRKTGT